MLCVVVKGPTYEEAYQQINEAQKYADLVELRLDFFESVNGEQLKLLRALMIPMIFTWKSPQLDHSYFEMIRRIASLNPEYLDLECDVPLDFLNELETSHPEVKVILSYHDFLETPENLDNILEQLRKKPAFFYKIALMAKNSLDAMRLLCWAKEIAENIIAISMGSFGQISRILGPIIQSPIVYASVNDQENMWGQLSAKILIDQYQFRKVSSKTAIYGLIGNPVTQSISDETHNSFFESCELDAVYVKIPIVSSELPQFLEYAKQLGFKGCSVTMPLKESIVNYLKEIDSQALEIGAVNTLVLRDDHWIGFNTDGIGALKAIEKHFSVAKKRVGLIGAGGAAKAIAYEAKRSGAFVTIINRTAEKAEIVAKQLDCNAQGLEGMNDYVSNGYDLLINCTPNGMPIEAKYLLSQALIMDITTKPKETEFLVQAKDKGCLVIYGYEMFAEQAYCQFKLWFTKL